MDYIIKKMNRFYSINGIDIKEEIHHEGLSDYQIRNISDYIDDLIDWISEATDDKETMKDDLKYLIKLDDEFMFSSIRTNEYICFSDNEEKFNELCLEFIELSK